MTGRAPDLLVGVTALSTALSGIAAFPGQSERLVSGCVQAKMRTAGKRTSPSGGIWAWDKDDLGGNFFWVL